MQLPAWRPSGIRPAAPKTVTSLEDWRSYLTNVGLDGLDISKFVPTMANAFPGVTVPIVGLSASGGGMRATMIDGGALSAFDYRNSTALAAKTGGILQLAQYLAGLSGGGLVVGSYALAGFPTFEGKLSFLMDAAVSLGLKLASGAPVSEGQFRADISNPVYEANPYRFRTDLPSGGGLSLPIEFLGTTGEGTPLYPLDAANGYPSGVDVHNSYRKSLQPGYGGMRMPVIPTPAVFASLGLTKKPVFFGSDCTPQPGNKTTALIVYLPNYNSVGYESNASGLLLQFSKQDQISFFNTAFAIATQKSSKAWAVCLACALVDAQQQRNGVPRTKQPFQKPKEG
ncbi:hypothetical protein RQP46_005977 [Phenoliferia psychrophenolica]